MTKIYVQPGAAITVPAPAGGTTSSIGVLIGSLFGIAATTEVEGEDVVLDTVGVFKHAKATGAHAIGDLIYWDDTSKRITKTATNNKLIGVAVTVAESGDAIGIVRLNGAFIA